MSTDRGNLLRLLAFVLAVAGPLLLNAPWPPGISHANQIAAIAGWGLVLLLVPAPAASARVLRAAAPLLAVLGIAAAACAASIVAGRLPSSPGIATMGIIALAALVCLHGASWGAEGSRQVFEAFAIGLLVAGLCGVVIALVQVFAGDHRSDTIVALASISGRASGHIGQPNQFADVLLWGLVALLVLARPRGEGTRGSIALRALVVLAGLALLLATVLTGSRTAFVSVALLALWGVLDRGLGRDNRLLLGTAPLTVAAMVWLVHLWQRTHGLQMDMLYRDSPDLTSFRGDIWRQAATLIAAQPWLGVGWGHFNFAWTLTPFAQRGAGLVTNAHDLPLQLAVEVGVPAAVLMMGLLLGALWRAFGGARRLPDGTGVAARAALMMVLVVGVHSMLEYPLWFAYLLFPTAWAWGLSLGMGTLADDRKAVAVQPAPAEPAPPRAWRIAGLLMLVTGLSAWFDYLNIVSLYIARPNMASFEDRIRSGQASPLFSSLADYVYTLHPTPGVDPLPVIERSSHVLLNGWLMLSWAEALDARGQTEKARYLAARLREFKLEGAKAFFAPCSDPTVSVKPYQCTPASTVLTWRDFERD